MSATEQPPIQLTILRQGDVNIVDLAEVGSLIPRSETQVSSTFLHELAAEVTRLTAPGYGRKEGPGWSEHLSRQDPDTVVEDLQQIGALVFSHLLTEPARKRLRTAEPCDINLRLDEQLIHIPWELCYDGSDFLITKFRVGRQIITSYPIPGAVTGREVHRPIKVLLIADPTESLSQASDEAERLCTQLDTISGIEVTLLGGKGVRKIPLLAALQTHDVVHFAGHSHYDAEHPTASGWRLHDDVLTAGELSKLSRPPLLVFSNSCQAGTTAEWAGNYRYEGQAFGIGSAFLLAGVKNYIGTFWVVHDEESELFAMAFYRSLITGQSLGEALLQARQTIISQRGWQSLTWASYMLYGDPTARLLSPENEAPAQLEQPDLGNLSSRQAGTSASGGATHQAEDTQPSPRMSIRWLAFLTLLVLGLSLYWFSLREPLTQPDRLDSALPLSTAPHTATDSGVSASQRQPPVLSQGQHQLQAVGVMHFQSLSDDPKLRWMRGAIRDSLNSQLSNAPGLKVYSKEYIDFLVQKGSNSEIEVANRLGVAKMISGSFFALTDTLRIEAHIVDVQTGLLEASEQVEGKQRDFFSLHRQLALQILARLDIAVLPQPKMHAPAPPAASGFDAYRLLLEAEGETLSPQSGEDDRTSLYKNTYDSSLVWLRWFAVGEAWAQAVPQPGYTPKEEIRHVLEQYRQAYEKKNLTLLDNVYDTLTTAQREANAKYFEQTQGLQVAIRDVDIAVMGNEAAMSYTREDRFIDAKTESEVKFEVRFTKFLVRLDNVWKISSKKKELWTPVGP